MSAGILIAGGGLAAQRAAEALRRLGYDGRLRMVCAEATAPYDRPPLSKEVLADAAAEASLPFRSADWYTQHDIDLLLGNAAAGLDLSSRTVTVADGGVVDFDQLLVATGSRPRTLPLLAGFENVSVLRDLPDAQRLRAALEPGARIAIIGAGFIGQEVAAAAVKAGAQVTIVETASAPLAAVLGPRVGNWFAHWHRRNHVGMALARQVVRVEGNGRARALWLDDGSRIECDHVVVGIGVLPQTAWLNGSELQINSDGTTNVEGVVAAGDVTGSGHWESAGRQGGDAARALLGLPPAKAGPSSFWSDLYGTRVQYLGVAAQADDLAVDGEPERQDFAVTYTRAGAPVAVLLVGRPHELPAARALLAA